PGAPAIDWWIAGDDRWYFPSREKTVRQSLLANTPVVETRMRVKGGDVCLRAYAVPVPTSSAMREVVVLEVENTTGVPCGVGFAVRPFGITADVPLHRISLGNGVVDVDGFPAIVLPRDPAGALAGTASDGDLADRAARGEAIAPSFAEVQCSEGLAQAVVVVPLAHRNRFRVVLPVPGGPSTGSADAGRFPRAVPPPENVARGWRAQVADLARFKVPDPRLQAVCDAAAPWLLATTNHPTASIGRSGWDDRDEPRWSHVAATAGALDRFGLPDRSAALLARAAAAFLDEPTGDASGLVAAFAAHVERTADRVFAEAVAECCVRISAARHPGAVAVDSNRRFLEATATVLDAAGESVGAARAVKSARRVVRANKADDTARVAVDVDPSGALDRAVRALEAGSGADAWAVLDAWLDSVAATVMWAETVDGKRSGPSVGLTSAVLSLVCDYFLTVRADAVRLVAHVPTAWFERPIEATGIVTPVGRGGYAVRWHGDRPAVLWDAAAGARLDPDLRVCAPGLDPTWVAHGATGEALLAPHIDSADRPVRGSRMIGLQIGPSRGAS
ncbi:MAG: hypothetical protein JST73_11480, partial [Actinobacteria bacterium]|nr:hypothetical protein [Actinomycetota bacterium]